MKECVYLPPLTGFAVILFSMPMTAYRAYHKGPVSDWYGSPSPRSSVGMANMPAVIAVSWLNPSLAAYALSRLGPKTEL